MKSVYITLLVLFAIPSLSAEIIQQEEHLSGQAGPYTKISWIRNGKKIFTQTFHANSPKTSCFFNFKAKKLDLVIWLTRNQISSVSTFSSDFLLSIDDFTKDGVADFIQIKDPNTTNLLQAFLIIKGRVIPLPEEKYKKDKSEFYFDDDIVTFIKQKEAESVEQGAAANP